MSNNKFPSHLKAIHVITMAIIIFFSVSCESFVSVRPPDSQIATAKVFNDWNAANAAMTAIYPQMASFNHRLQTFLGLYGDELATEIPSGISNALYTNSVDPLTNSPSQIWNDGFNIIYQANAVIEGGQNSKTFSDQEQYQLIGEGLFVRAFINFYLSNVYGEIPLVLTTDYKRNNRLSRIPVPDVMQQIIADLEESRKLLGIEYIDAKGNSGTIERVRPNKYAVLSLLSRVYLYMGRFELASELTTMVISENNLYDTVSLSDVFLKNNKEAIWQIPPSSKGPQYSTPDGRNYVISGNVINQYLSDKLLNAFTSGDLRKNEWVGYYLRTNVTPPTLYPFPFKYKHDGNNSTSIGEYYTALRLAEQYLIRAEARAQLGQIAGALDDLNLIRQRAGLSSFVGETKELLLSAILEERNVELFCEWGHRWFDLSRTGRIDEIMPGVAKQKGGSWQSYKRLWPIQQVELDRNPNLVQTPGYENLSNSI